MLCPLFYTVGVALRLCARTLEELVIYVNFSYQGLGQQRAVSQNLVIHSVM